MTSIASDVLQGDSRVRAGHAFRLKDSRPASCLSSLCSYSYPPCARKGRGSLARATTSTMLNRLSPSTTRSTARTTVSGTATGGGVADPVMSTTDTAKVRRKRTLKNRFGLQRLHPDHTNPALRSKVNDPRVSGSEAKEAQVALGDRAAPKRTLSTKLKRLSNKWRSSGTATSKTTAATY